VESSDNRALPLRQLPILEAGLDETLLDSTGSTPLDDDREDDLRLSALLL
jgi:hypothetical protein